MLEKNHFNKLNDSLNDFLIKNYIRKKDVFKQDIYTSDDTIRLKKGRRPWTFKKILTTYFTLGLNLIFEKYKTPRSVLRDENHNDVEVIFEIKGILFKRNKENIYLKEISKNTSFDILDFRNYKVSQNESTSTKELVISCSEKNSRLYVSNKQWELIKKLQYKLSPILNDISDYREKLNLIKLSNEEENRKKEELKKIEKEKKHFDLIKSLNVEFKNKFESIKDKVISPLDKNNDGIPDIIEENLFENLLKINENEIIQIEREFSTEYTHNMIRLSNFLKYKKTIIIDFFTSIKKITFDIKNYNSFGNDPEVKKILEKFDLPDEDDKIFKNIKTNDLIEYYSSFEIEFFDTIESYCSYVSNFHHLVLNSSVMLTYLLKKSKLKFYEYYELFDELGVFNSTLEKQIKNQMELVNRNLSSVINNINKLEGSLVKGFEKVDNNINKTNENLTDVISKQEKTENLLDNQLKKMNSKMTYNNLMTTINTYNTYKIRKTLEK